MTYKALSSRRFSDGRGFSSLDRWRTEVRHYKIKRQDKFTREF
jgi:hypothetical protein